MKRHGTLVLAAALFLLFLGCDKAEQVKEIKLAHGLSTEHPVHKGMVYFAEEVTKNSGGKLKVSIYPNGQLGSESQCLELLQIGSLGITKVSAAAMESFAPKYKVLSIPYIYKSKEHMYTIQDGPIGQEILDSGVEYWLKGLCFYDAGSRSFYTRERAIRTPADVKGLKIRVMKSITANKMISELGGSPVPIAWGELYTALQQGVVDGAENNPPSFYLSRHYETCKYYTLDRHTAVPDVLVISTIVWNRLTEEERQWVQKAAQASLPVQRKYWDESEKESLDAVVEAGIQIIEVDVTEFAEETKKILEEFKENPDLQGLISKIEKIDA
ncbi:MAG: TRAP transporter substrate-binding protein [Bacteroidota bacterium]